MLNKFKGMCEKVDETVMAYFMILFYHMQEENYETVLITSINRKLIAFLKKYKPKIIKNVGNKLRNNEALSYFV